MEGQKNQDQEKMLCPNCLAENKPGLHFCMKCGCPLSSIAHMDPIKRIYFQGWSLRRAVSGPILPVVFWGMWVFLGMALISTIIIIYLNISGHRGYFNMIDRGMLFYLIPAAVIYSVLLFRITKNYLRHKRKK